MSTMPIPPTLVRRLVVAPLVLLLEAAFLLLSPVLAVIAAALAPVAGGSRPLRVLAIAVGFAARHAACTMASACGWRAGSASGPPHRGCSAPTTT